MKKMSVYAALMLAGVVVFFAGRPPELARALQTDPAGNLERGVT